MTITSWGLAVEKQGQEECFGPRYPTREMADSVLERMLAVDDSGHAQGIRVVGVHDLPPTVIYTVHRRHLKPIDSPITWVNLTPHAITIAGENGDFTVPPSGNVCRLVEYEEPIGELHAEPDCGHVPIVRMAYGQLLGLPEQTPGVRYLVSLLCLASDEARRRGDVFAPAHVERDERGQPTRARALACAPGWIVREGTYEG